MQSIIFLVKRKLGAYFQSDNWKGILGDAFYAIILFLYALVAGSYYNAAEPKMAMSLINSVAYILIVIPIFSKFFPTFLPKKVIIAPQYPLSKVKKATIDMLVFAINRTLYIILLLFILIFFFTAKGLFFQYLFILLLSLLMGMLFAENLINALSWRKYIQLVLLIVLAVLYYFIFNKYGFVKNTIWWQVGIGMALLFSYYIFYQSKGTIQFSRKKNNLISPNRNYIIITVKFLIRNKSIKTNLFLALVFMVAFPYIIFSKVKVEDLGTLFSNMPFYSFFFLPVVIFTYIFNNLWGFYNNMILNLLIIKATFKNQIQLYIFMLLPVLLVELIFTTILLFCEKLLEWKILLFYVAFSFCSIPIGLISSYLGHKKLPDNYNFMQIRINSPVLSVIILLVLALLIGIFYSSKYYFILVIALILMGFGLFCYLLKNEKYLLYRLNKRVLWD